MKTINFIEIENRQVITGIENTGIDPEETRKKVEAVIAASPDVLLSKTRDQLLLDNAVFFRSGSGQIPINDAEGDVLLDALKNLGPHEKLLISGETIADMRGVEYWVQESGHWHKQQIEHLGEGLPADAILPESLSQAQRQAIAEQAEAERLANLTPEQKAEEKEAAITAAKKEARRLKEEAEIADEDFDAKSWFQAKKMEIEQQYE